jgi:hypothetical protein
MGDVVKRIEKLRKEESVAGNSVDEAEDDLNHNSGFCTLRGEA